MRIVVLPLFALLMAVSGCGKAELAPRDAAPKFDVAAPPSVDSAAQCNAGEELVLQKEEPKPSSSEDPGFRFPEDHAGALLAKTLPPSELRPVIERTTEPRQRPGSPRVESPSLPLPPCHTDLPRVVIVSKHTTQPHPLMEEAFFLTHADALLPTAIVLEAAERVRVPSVDVNKPMPLPILAKPLSDRALFDDVTTDASNAAALSGTMPTRTTPAPFLKLTVPDPFENRKPVAPPVTQSEDVPNTTPTLPKR
jgi:hypothetical protein